VKKKEEFDHFSQRVMRRDIMHGSILPVTTSPRANPGTSPALRARGFAIV